MRVENTLSTSPAVAPMRLSDVLTLSDQHHYRFIPEPIWEYLRSKKVRPAAKEVYLELLHDAMKHRSQRRDFISERSIAWISRQVDLSESTVKKALRELVEAELIVRVRRPRQDLPDLPAITHFLPPPALFLQRHRRSSETPPLRIASNRPSRQPERPKVPSPAPVSPAARPDDLASPPTPNSPSAAPNDALLSKLQLQLQELTTQLQQAAEARDMQTYHRLVAAHSALSQRLTALKTAKEPQQPPHSKDAISKEHVKPKNEQPTGDQKRIAQKPLASPNALRHSPSTVSNTDGGIAHAQSTDAAPRTEGDARVPRKLSKGFRAAVCARIARIPKISNPKELLEQVLFQLEKGVYNDMPPRKALNVCLSTIRKGRWRTPIGFPTKPLSKSCRAQSPAPEISDLSSRAGGLNGHRGGGTNGHPKNNKTLRVKK